MRKNVRQFEATVYSGIFQPQADASCERWRNVLFSLAQECSRPTRVI